MTHSDKAALRGEPSYVWRSGQDRRLRMVEQWADLSGTVLDNGCGLGTYLEKFGRYPGNHFGNEIEEERAQQALTRSDGVVVSPGEFLAFADGSFNTVFSNEVIEHVQNDSSGTQCQDSGRYGGGTEGVGKCVEHLYDVRPDQGSGRVSSHHG